MRIGASMKSLYSLQELMKKAELNHAEMHGQLMACTADMPVKRIMVNDEPYLDRYYVCTEGDGTQHWLHHFLLYVTGYWLKYRA